VGARYLQREYELAMPRVEDKASLTGTTTTPAPTAPISGRSGQVSVPTVSLPKSGGAIRGLGEKFAINPATGTGALALPLVSSPGRATSDPQLSLTYDSGMGNGPFGFGWSLSLPAITRKTDTGLPRYLDGDESDVFILSGAEDLVPILDGANERITFSRTVNGVDYRIHLYRPRIEGLFARIERWARVDDQVSHWRTITVDNVTTLFGLDANSRVFDPRDPRRVFSYLISRTFDDQGNASCYEYSIEDAAGVDLAAAHEANRSETDRVSQRYPKRICYGNAHPYFPDWSSAGPATPLPADWHFQLVFDYGDHRPKAPAPTRTPAVDPPWPVRPDPFSSFRSGFEVRSYRRCKRVLLFHQFAEEEGFGEPYLVRSTDLVYSDEHSPEDSHNPTYSFLASVTQSGYRRSDSGYEKRSTPPLEFFYSQPEVHPEVLILGEADGDDLPDELDGTRPHWLDLEGEGLTGMLTERNGGWYYWRNVSPINRVTLPDGERAVRARFGSPERIAPPPMPAGTGGAWGFLDLTGEGRPDLVAFDAQAPGFFARLAEQDWEPLRPFTTLPRLDWSEPNLAFVDLTGDGRADVLITEERVYTFYPSRGVEGFGPGEQVPTPADEQRGPRVVFADGTETVFLADMSGDGLSDLVRVRNGEVCYWPNLGYGRFGAKITMDGSPRFTDEALFDPRRIRFADVDGSGTADLLYAGDDAVRLCFNRSGNSWATPQQLAVFPDADPARQVEVFDLLGTGTACLVCSSPLPMERHSPLRYVDLMGSRKPHLLVGVRNNLGAETRLTYAPSTRFFLEDQRAGHPWITRLPFPVQVVERVESYDWIGRSRFVTRYAYHHGYFDGEEREFRGFGMVEQWDTETHREDTLFPEVETTGEEAESFVPPMLTRTWFHTGAFLGAGTVSGQYAHEYWVEPILRGDAPAARQAILLPDSALEGRLPPDEMREAYRALKGSVLRVEVYSLDGTARAEHPYTVTEQNLSVRRVQARGPNRHAVFLTHSREFLRYHYERRPADPRVTHELTLEVDEFGNVLRSVSIAYGRRAGYPEPEPGLSDAFRAMLAYDQSRLHIGATEHVFTHPVGRPTDPAPLDAYRAPLPCETITAELTGIAPAAFRFGFDEMDRHWTTLWSGTRDIPYEEVSTAQVEGVGSSARFGRRIVSRDLTLYRRDDLTSLLPRGVAQARALPGESYRLALTPGLIDRIFGTRVTSTDLLEGGYVQPAGQDAWWVPSGRLFYSPGDADTPAQELAEARAHFYLPRRAVNPFGAVARVEYDRYDLLPSTAIDALGNRTAARNDYRVLQPFHVTDHNGNSSAAAFDCLGQVVGTAVGGKADEGDSLVGFDADLSELEIQAVMTDPLAAARATLQNATSRIVFDLFAYFRTRTLPRPDPPAVYMLTRDTHVSEQSGDAPTRFCHFFAYSDGFGREVQHKAQAEPGPVPSLAGSVTPRWVGSGWTIYNNKGKPVRTYQPFFSRTPRFEFNRRAGVASVLFYDPAERLVGTVHPDFTFEKTVFDAWRQETWDANDTVLVGDPRTDPDVGAFFQRLFGSASGAFVSWHDRRIGGALGSSPEDCASNQDAARKAAAHAATPTVAHLDALGRTSLSVSDNGAEAGVALRFPLRTSMDTEGKPLAVFDARGRHLAEYCLREPLTGGGGFRYVAGYDLAGNALYHGGMDSGERRTLVTVLGDPLRAWNARGFAFHFRYDALRRLTHRFAAGPGAPEVLLERCVYGDRHPDTTRNLKGRLFRRYDGAGVASNERYDFKGNLLESGRQLARLEPATAPAAFYDTAPDWSPLTDVVDVPTLDLAALDAAAAPLLVPADRFIASCRFDALNRPTQMVTPHLEGGPSSRPSVIQPLYNEANLLERIDVWIRPAVPPAAQLHPASADVHAITGIDYNEHGQRLRVNFGNGSFSCYGYDPDTQRLATLTTRRPNTFPADERTVQALVYQYDPVGNVTRLRDVADVHDVLFFRNRRIESSADYTYDPIYRLVAATGREHLGQTGNSLSAPQQGTNDDSSRTGFLLPTDGSAMGTYIERYAYDPVGNLLRMVHQVATGSWTRRYAYDEASAITATETSNRLSATSLPGAPPSAPFGASYAHDENGNVTRMPHLSGMTWDADDHLQSTTRQVVDAGFPEITYYSYDAEGERVRKVTMRRTAAGRTPTCRCERLYLGILEVYREYDGAGNLVKERETLNVLLDQKRIVMVETLTVGEDQGPPQLMRYQYGNHLGSAVVELDADAELITYEEYFPYGSTSFQGCRPLVASPKRYRYTGKERDEETDLYYHGARYYAPWLGRWTASDPIGLGDGPNVYMYVSGNPVALSDPTGMFGWREIAALAAMVVVGAVVTVATAGLAGPVVAGAVASVGLSGAAATVTTGVAVGAIAGAAGGAAGELTRQVVSGESISGRAIGQAALTGVVLGGITGGLGAAVSTARGAAALASASAAVSRTGVGAVGRALAAGARAVARVPGVRQVVESGQRLGSMAARGLQGLERGAENLGIRAGNRLYAPGSMGARTVERFNQSRTLAGAFDENEPRVYRVQGGIPPAASRIRIGIAPNGGQMQIQGRDMLHVTFEDAGHTREFLQRRPGGTVISFRVNRGIINNVRANAVPQFGAPRGVPQIDDPTMSASAFGLPRGTPQLQQWHQGLINAAVPGTGRMGGIGLLNNPAALVTGGATGAIRHHER
jgi:RHS repeat-associated protein